ncbi:hypothetical protein GCM10009422_02620 [Brevundimonas kwangchunensis]|uniref:Uncharacterized protein n=1 Tax=Brevundimonas kwangchunensis TaxID=322163 RepID=A0ABN1GGT1_9CAUL
MAHIADASAISYSTPSAVPECKGSDGIGPTIGKALEVPISEEPSLDFDRRAVQIDFKILETVKQDVGDTVCTGTTFDLESIDPVVGIAGKTNANVSAARTEFGQGQKGIVIVIAVGAGTKHLRSEYRRL